MPVFDFNNSPQDSKVPECTYKVFYTNCPESSPEHPILILDNKAGKLVHHSNGIFTNPIRRTAFEFKTEKGTAWANILKIGSLPCVEHIPMCKRPMKDLWVTWPTSAMWE